MFKNLFRNILAMVMAGSMVAAPAFVLAENTPSAQDQQGQARAAGSTLEIHITDNGKVLVRGAKVTGVSGSSIQAETAWGSVHLEWAVNTTSGTQLVRRYGGTASFSEISTGDFISFMGTLDTAIGTPYTVNASVVKDWSIQKTNATFSGTVKSVDAGTSSFVLTTTSRGDVTVKTGSGTQITKAGTTGTFTDIVVGGALSASGVWDNVNNTLAAQKITIRVPKPAPTTIQGTVKTASSGAAPSSFILTVNGSDYTVNVSASTSVLNSLWAVVPLTSVAAGNTVRVYGVVNTANVTVAATVVRDISLK